MNIQEFLRLIEKQRSCPQTLPKALQAMWYEKQGNWVKAHEIVQNASDIDSAWVHAYLHRQEGDLSNARYWYKKSNQPEFFGDIKQEWEEITACLLKKANTNHGC
jgi:hypothetical protein